jgi:acyl-CoA synthetase (AMP-forming)/AMP-acid ligase II
MCREEPVFAGKVICGGLIETGGQNWLSKVCIIAAHPDVAECAVIGASDKLKGEVPLALVLLKTGTTRPHQEIAADSIATSSKRDQTLLVAGASHRQ